MTPEQRKHLLEACEAGDDVRIVTLALHIAATAAREGRTDTAVACRRAVDRHQQEEADARAHQEKRLTIATQLLAGVIPHLEGPSFFMGSDRAHAALAAAEDLLRNNRSFPQISYQG